MDALLQTQNSHRNKPVHTYQSAEGWQTITIRDYLSLKPRETITPNMFKYFLHSLDTTPPHVTIMSPGTLKTITNSDLGDEPRIPPNRMWLLLPDVILDQWRLVIIKNPQRPTVCELIIIDALPLKRLEPLTGAVIRWLGNQHKKTTGETADFTNISVRQPAIPCQKQESGTGSTTMALIEAILDIIRDPEAIIPDILNYATERTRLWRRQLTIDLHTKNNILPSWPTIDSPTPRKTVRRSPFVPATSPLLLARAKVVAYTKQSQPPTNTKSRERSSPLKPQHQPEPANPQELISSPPETHTQGIAVTPKLAATIETELTRVRHLSSTSSSSEDSASSSTSSSTNSSDTPNLVEPQPTQIEPQCTRTNSPILGKPDQCPPTPGRGLWQDENNPATANTTVAATLQRTEITQIPADLADRIAKLAIQAKPNHRVRRKITHNGRIILIYRFRSGRTTVFDIGSAEEGRECEEP